MSEPNEPGNDAAPNYRLPLRTYPACHLRADNVLRDTTNDITIIGITEIERCFWRKINQVLKRLPGTMPNDLETKETASFSVYKGQDVDPVFLLSMKENISSNSAIWTSFGVGAFESCFAYFRTQLAIV